VRDVVVSGLDRLSSLSLLRPAADTPAALDTLLGLGGDAGPVEVLVGLDFTVLGAQHSYSAKVVRN